MKRFYALKIKLKSLAAEAHIIRQEQRRFLQKAKEFKKLKKNQASTACMNIANDLHCHRVNVVRAAARATHIAYAFMKEKNVFEIDTNMENFHDHKHVIQMLNRYADMETSNKYREEIMPPSI